MRVRILCYPLSPGGVGREPTQLTLRQVMKQLPLRLERAATSVWTRAGIKDNLSVRD
jgi:hypothetical protein